MRVAAALVHDEPARIAARREPASVQVHEACGSAGAIGRFDADPPWLTVTPRRARDDVAAEIDQAAQVRSNAFDLRCGQVDGVLLADAAKVDLHARLQLQYGFAPLPAMPAGQLQNGVDLRLRRHATAAVERPHSAQDAGGDVEAPLRKPGERRSEVDEAGRFLIEYDRASVARVDLVKDVVIAIAAELALDAPSTARGCLDDVARERRGRRFDEHLARRSHCDEPADPIAALVRERDLRVLLCGGSVAHVCGSACATTRSGN